VLRPIVLVAVAVLAGACGGSEDEAPSPSEQRTRLEISVWRAGTDGPVRVATVECPVLGDTSMGDTCDQLDALEDPFAPLPEGAVCTQIYGGPQVAEVRGTYRGETVNARFNRTNGCEIERWDRIAFLFPT
jgi:hypothetical protein